MEKMPVQKDETNEVKRFDLWNEMKGYLPYLLIGVLLAVGLRVFITPSVVVGESMEGSLHDGDKLLVNKLAYSEKKLPEYGDVVILSSDEVEGEALFIKRVVGKPGDTLDIIDGELYRNGKKVEEPYAKEKMEDSDMTVSIEAGEVFVLGDNRNHSMDSRIIGSVNVEEEVVGKVISRVIPFDQSYKANE